MNGYTGRAAAAAMLAFCLVRTAAGEPANGTPFVQRVESNRATVVWETAETAAGTVEYGRGGFFLSASEIRAATIHRVVLGNLEPGALYAYRCRWGGEASETRAFRTAPLPGRRPVRAAVIGSAGGGDGTRRLLDAVDSFDPDLVIHTGNLAPGGLTEAERRAYIRDRFAPVFANAWLLAAPGESDLASSSFPRLFGGPGGETYYSVKYGDVRFLVLDGAGLDEPAGPQYEWLEAQLARGEREWTAAVLHRPLFSAVGAPDSRTHLQTLFERYGVSLVLSGHERLYHRTYPVGRVGGFPQKGVVHVTSAGGGGLETAWPAPHSAFAMSAAHAVILDIGPETIHGAAVDVSGKAFDSFSIGREAGAGPNGYISSEMLGLEKAIAGQCRSMTPVLATEELVEVRGKIEVPVPFQVPARGRMRWGGNHDWTVSPENGEFAIEPGKPMVLEYGAFVKTSQLYPIPSLELNAWIDAPFLNPGEPPLGFRNTSFRVAPWRVYPVRTAEIPRAASGVAVDGSPADAAWNGAWKAERFFDSRFGTAPGRSASAMALHDGERLYVWASMQRRGPAPDVPAPAADHPSLARGEHFEAAVWAGGNRYSFLVSPAGIMADGRNGDFGWNGGWTAAAAGGEGEWTAEMAIPLNEAGIGDGEWRFNLIRFDATERRKSALVPALGAPPEDAVASYRGALR